MVVTCDPVRIRRLQACTIVTGSERNVALKVLLASPRCCCAGVDRAVQIVEMALERFGTPIYVRKEIVHNNHVVDDLRQRGVIFVDELDGVPDGALTIFSAHGVAPSVHEDARKRRLRIVDATCPLVTKVHLEVARFVRDGYHIILIGREGHEEVDGTLGQAPARITLIEDVEQARTKAVPDAEKLMVLTQTTLSMDDTEVVMEALRARFGHLELPPAEDICYATQNRQNAVRALCERGIDLLLVVGSPNSSNAARLAEVAAVRGVLGRLIDSADELDPEWLVGASAIGVTGGASTPDAVVQSVVERLEALGATEVELCVSAEENTVFQLPAMNPSRPPAADQEALSSPAGGTGAT